MKEYTKGSPPTLMNQEPGVIHPFSNPLLKTPVFPNNGCNTAANLKFTQVHTSSQQEKVKKLMFNS